MAKLKTFTVELRWHTGDEWSDHLIEVRSIKPIGARYAALEKLKHDWEIPDGTRIQCRAVFSGVNLWPDEEY